MKYKIPLISLGCLFMLGCSHTSKISINQQQTIPDTWYSQPIIEPSGNSDISLFNAPFLNQYIVEGINNNHALKQEWYKVAILEQQLDQDKAYLWPDLSIGLSSQRSESATTEVITTRHNLQLSSSYELDVWGKLSDNQRQTYLSLLAAQNQYQAQKQTLSANITKQWFNLIAAHQLLDIFQQSLTNAEQSLDIVTSRYKQGLNKALDVYLARNELNTARSTLAAQQSATLALIRQFEQTLGRYPSGTLLSDISQPALPELPINIPVGLPSELIKRQPSIIAAWQQVLAQDAALAFAHKQRFPSLRLTASLSNTSSELSDLVSGSTLVWSLLNNITAPLFNSGELKAGENIALLRLKQQEQNYLNQVLTVFADVENAITNEGTLLSRYQAILSAQENASTAQELALEQYQRGLVTYTTVLDAQERALNAKRNLIQLKAELLNNRVNLHLALGGDFAEFNQKGNLDS